MREYAASEIFPGFYSIQSQKSVSIKSQIARSVTLRSKNARIFGFSKTLRKGQLHETVTLRWKLL